MNIFPSCKSLNALTLTLCVSLFSLSHTSHAKKDVSPLTIKGTTKINAEELIQHVEQTPDLLIIDSRLTSDRTHGYIEDSISLPDENTRCSTLAKIIKRKNSPVIFYCNGPKCGRSATATKIAIRCGYSKTYWFRGGIEEWKNKSYPLITD